MNRLRVVTVGATATMALIAGYFYYLTAVANLKAKFAADQISIFYEMRDQVEHSTPADMASRLQYMVAYYPSGTKQEAGTPLDIAVESVRRHCIGDIVARLRASTGKDLGNDAEPWIRDYASASTNEHAGQHER